MIAVVRPFLTQAAATLRGGLIPLWEFMFGTTAGLLLTGAAVGAVIPWRAGAGIAKVFSGLLAFIVGTYVILVLGSIFETERKR